MAQAPHPRMHGLTHLAGGSDPVPFLPSADPGSYADAVFATTDLRAYWRLGDGDQPYLDTSGYSPSTPANAAILSGTAPMDKDVAGALPAAHDDGAVRFHYPGADGADNTAERLQSTHGDGGRFNFNTLTEGHRNMSVACWVNVGTPAAVGAVNTDYLVSCFGTVAGGVSWLGGWALVYDYNRTAFAFTRFFDSSNAGPYEAAAPAGPLDGWVHLAGTYDGATIRLYVNGVLADSTPDTHELPSHNHEVWIGLRSVSAVDEAAVWSGVLSPSQVATLAGKGGTLGDEDLVLGLDENGNPAWVQPKVEVTVNGEAADTTPNPPRPDPVPPPDGGGVDGDDWIQDQPFTWGGPTFQVPPNKWTTIPFTNPLMERHSNVTGGSTTWFELDPDDPASAGWVDPATPRVITIPHDMEFNPGNFQWFQICLKLETPPVEDEIFVEGTVTRGSHRGLRVFETTHQKSIVEAFNWRGACCDEHGAIDVFRDPTKHPGLLGDAAMFALGDPGGEHNLEHGNIMLVPNSGYGYYIPGMDWLPGHGTGNPVLKKGMRLVPQVWHNASTTLTFDCTGVLPYRPHFAMMTFADRGWGPPWSDWPLYS